MDAMSSQDAALSLMQLRCFLAVVDGGSFTQAGRQPGLSVSGVSKTIAWLEASHGVRLVHRSTHALSPTEAGERLVAPARAALAGADEAELLLGSLARSPSLGRVRVSAPVAFARTCLIPLMPVLHNWYPNILLDLSASDLLVDLAEGGIDVALRSGSLEGLPGHVSVTWFRVPWVATVAPCYLARKGVPTSPAALGAHDLIGFRNARTRLVQPWRLRGYNPSSRPPTYRVVLDDAEAAWRAVMAGVGIASCLRWLVAGALAAGAVTEILRDLRGEAGIRSILRRDRKLLPERVRKTVDFLMTHADQFGSVDSNLCRLWSARPDSTPTGGLAKYPSSRRAALIAARPSPASFGLRICADVGQFGGSRLHP